MVGSVELQEIFTTYYNGNLRMWELPFPGSTVRVIAFNDPRGKDAAQFQPGIGAEGRVKHLFELCSQRTGCTLQHRTITTPF